jgi:hypothetical protein
MKFKLLALGATLLASTAFAQMPPPPTGQMNPEVKAAAQACDASVKKEANGRPDHQAFKECMEAKGFKRPEGGPRGPQGEHKGPPPEGKRPPPPRQTPPMK